MPSIHSIYFYLYPKCFVLKTVQCASCLASQLARHSKLGGKCTSAGHVLLALRLVRNRDSPVPDHRAVTLRASCQVLPLAVVLPVTAAELPRPTCTTWISVFTPITPNRQLHLIITPIAVFAVVSAHAPVGVLLVAANPPFATFPISRVGVNTSHSFSVLISNLIIQVPDLVGKSATTNVDGSLL